MGGGLSGLHLSLSKSVVALPEESPAAGGVARNQENKSVCRQKSTITHLMRSLVLRVPHSLHHLT